MDNGSGKTQRNLMIANNMKSDYSDCMTGGLTRVDSVVSVDVSVSVSGNGNGNGNEDGYQRALHPSDILSKSKYFNQLFGFLAYPYDIACEAWEILRKLPLNRDKKLCVKDFNNGWNKMFDLKQHQSVLMARYGLDILSKLTRNDVKMYKQSKCNIGSDDNNNNNNNNNNNEEEINRRTIKRCFSLLRMAIDNFGGKRHGDIINIDLRFCEVFSNKNKDNKNDKNTNTNPNTNTNTKTKTNGPDKLKIQMGELQSCKELAERVAQEIAKKCHGKQYNIKGLIKAGKRIDTQDNATLADEFTFNGGIVTVVYTTSDLPQQSQQNQQQEQKTQSCNNNNNNNIISTPMLKKPPLRLETTMVCDATPNSPSSNQTTVDGDVDVDIEAMENDPKMIEEQKRIETSLRSVDRIDSHRETNPSPPPPPSVAGNVGNSGGATGAPYPVTPRPTMARKQPQFGQNGPKKPDTMKKLHLNQMYKNGSGKTQRNLMIANNMKSDYSDCMTGGLTRVDSVVSVDVSVSVSGNGNGNGNEDGYQRALHPSDILSKSKYFNQLFGFLAYPYDIACEAWEILRKLPLNRDKKLCVKDFNNGWNKMFDLKQHQSVLMARYGLDILSKLTRNDVKMYKQSKCNIGSDDNNNNNNN
eukprot:22673_1